MTLVWLSSIGLSTSLIFATILVKMLRVYCIFTAFKILKRNARLSDFALFIYTVLIMSPNIILLMLWTTVDPLCRVDNSIEHRGFIESHWMTCHSNYENIWYALGFVYVFLLLAAVIIVAIKSRKFDSLNLRTQKRLICLSFSSIIIVGFCTFSYWKLLLYSGFIIHSLIVLYAGHNLMAFLCQIILFVPKIWPALQKKASCTCTCICNFYQSVRFEFYQWH